MSIVITLLSSQSGFLEFYPFLDVMWALDLALVFRKIYDDKGCGFRLIDAVKLI